MTKYTTTTPAETQKIASKILKELSPKGVLCLYGQLGAGKTTFTKGLALEIGMPESYIKSPTYTYVREHQHDGKAIFHCDLYRLEGKPGAAREIISELLLRNPDLLIIEWAEHLESELPELRTDIHFKVKNEKREITVKHHTKKNVKKHGSKKH